MAERVVINTTLTPPPAIRSSLAPPPAIVTTLQPAPAIATTLVAGQGPAGRPGRDGDGSGAGDLHYRHDQMAAAAVWTLAHNLGKYPSAVVIDRAGDEVVGRPVYESINSMRLEFTAAFAGTAFLN